MCDKNETKLWLLQKHYTKTVSNIPHGETQG